MSLVVDLGATCDSLRGSHLIRDACQGKLDSEIPIHSRHVKMEEVSVRVRDS